MRAGVISGLVVALVAILLLSGFAIIPSTSISARTVPLAVPASHVTTRLTTSCSRCVVDNIPVGQTPLQGTYDPANGDVYVANFNSDNVSVIDGATNSVLRNLAVGGQPSPPVYDPASGNLYVANTFTDNISVISGSTQAILTSIPLPGSPGGIFYDNQSGNLLVTATVSSFNGWGDVFCISSSSNTILATIPTGYNLGGAAFDPVNGDLYVPEGSRGNVSIISGMTDSVVGEVGVGELPINAMYDPGNGEIYVANNDSGNLTVVSGSTQKVVASITTGMGVRAPTYDPANGDLYVWYVAKQCYGSLPVYSGTTNLQVRTIPTGCGAGQPVYDPGNQDIFIPGRENITPEFAFGSSLVSGTTVGFGPEPVAYDSANGELYVSNEASDNVSVLDGGCASNVGPICGSFGASPTMGGIPLTVTFWANLSGGAPPYYYSWNFTGNGGAWGPNPVTYTYTTAGTYPVTLYVQDSVGNYGWWPLVATIRPGAINGTLVALASASPMSGTAPLTVQFTGGASAGVPPYSYSWGFGNGIFSHAQDPTHTFNSTGTYPVSLAVTDSRGFQATTSLTINAYPSTVPLTVSPSATPGSGVVPLTVAFAATPGGGTPPFQYSWFFGDGSPPSRAQDPTHTYNSSGSFNATVTVQDSVDQLADSYVWVTAVSSVSTLLARPSANKISGSAPLTVSFSGTASGGQAPYSYDWTFGDGSSSTLQDPTHTFARAGTFSTSLEVTDSRSATAISWLTITASASAAPTLASVTVSPENSTLSIGQSETLTAVAHCTADSEAAACPLGLVYSWTHVAGFSSLNASSGASVTVTGGCAPGPCPAAGNEVGSTFEVTAVLNGASRSSNVTVEVVGATPPSPTGLLGLPGIEGDLVVGAIAVAAAVVVVLALFRRRGRKVRPPSGPPTKADPTEGELTPSSA